MKLSIIIPVYNDKDYIAQTIEQVRAVRFPIPYEIIAVDDASTDGSREILRSLSGIQAYFHETNTGKGGAVATGISHASGDIIAIQDDDCEYDPAVLPSLIEPILSGRADAVYGSRFLADNQMFFVQRLENMAITALASLLIGKKLSDVETGHKVFSRACADKLALTKQGFEFDMEITLQLLRQKARIVELPTRYTARTHAQGKKITYKDGIRSVQTLVAYTLRQWNAMHIAAAAVLLAAIFIPRLWQLGHILTVDEPLWLSRGETFIRALSIGDLRHTLVAGQPGVTTAWLVGLTAPWHSLATGQAAVAVATGLLVLLATYFFSLLIGKKWAFITGLFLALDPFLIAHSRVVHTDALVALFYLCALLALLVALRRPQRPERRYLLYSGVLAGGAILTKIFGFILLPTVTIIIMLVLRRQPAPLAAMLRAWGIWIAACALTVFAFWPVLWTHSDAAYNYLFSRAELHSGGTREEETTSAPWYYLREEFFRLTVPVTLLLPVTLWQLRRAQTSKTAAMSAIVIASGLAFALIINLSSDKSDRYILFSHITLIATAPLGLRAAAEWLGRTARWRAWVPAAVSLPILFLAADDIRLEPYYLAHYNQLYPVEARHKLGWGEGLEQAAAWITANHPGAKVIAYYPRVFSYFYPGSVETASHVDDAQGDYLVLYRSMFERGADAVETDIVNHYINNPALQPVHVITINGLPYVWIYALHP
jgi:glycosyltransferase involved in cell wall biosynthesis